jgi:cytochrome c553
MARRSLQNPLRAVLLAAALAAGPGGAWAGADAGKAKARPCAVCHGPLGVAILPEAPNLAGQPEPYLAEQLKAYRSGRRTHQIMSLMAKPLSDDDIDDLAAWFASVKIEAKAPP